MIKQEVLASIDASWREFKSTIESMTSNELCKPIDDDKKSVDQLLTHISRTESNLTRILLGDTGLDDVIESSSSTVNRPIAQTITELDEVHRALRKTLGDASETIFESGTKLRDSIDEATTFHYIEHRIEILSLIDVMRQ